VRWIGILGIILATVVTGSADAMDENRPCLDLLAENGGVDDSLAEQPLLTRNQCEALKTRELRALLLEIPQEDEDPMALSLGIKTAVAYSASRYHSVSSFALALPLQCTLFSSAGFVACHPKPMCDGHHRKLDLTAR
jgi:hypothetical protein